jgi:hypothetical protein
MSEPSSMQLPVIVRDYVRGLPAETRLQLLRAAVLRWFNEPLFVHVREELGELVSFDEFIQLPVIVRTSRDTYTVLSSMKEELVSILRDESADAVTRVNLLAANFFHRPLGEVYVAQVSAVIEEIAYLSQFDLDGCAERLAEFGYRALLSGWIEAADRASMVARAAITPADGAAHLATTALLLESAVSAVAQDERLGRSEQRRLNGLANEAERAEYATESLQLLAGLVRKIAAAREHGEIDRWLETQGEISNWSRDYLQGHDSANSPLSVVAVAGPSSSAGGNGETSASPVYVTVEPSEEVKIGFSIGSFSVRTMARAGSALLTALVAVVLVFAGAGAGTVLSHIQNIDHIWTVSGIFSPTVIFFILRISTYIGKWNGERVRAGERARARSRVRTRR